MAIGALACLLTACAAPHAPTPAASAPLAPASAPAAEPAASEATAPAVAPSGPVSATAQQQAQKSALAAAEFLQAGNEEQARSELKRATLLDPNNKLAQSLQRQMTVDPLAALGRESFAYTVRPGDSLSRLAGRFLGDIHGFYLLARYNDIKVPRQLEAGQVIRIPGKAPPLGVSAAATTDVAPRPQPAAPQPPPGPASAAAAAPPEPGPGERALRSGAAAERAGDLQRAFGEYTRAASADQPGAADKADRVRKLLLTQYVTNARGAAARHDLDTAIAQWQRVLALDPGNATARLELERAQHLKDKLGNVH